MAKRPSRSRRKPSRSKPLAIRVARAAVPNEPTNPRPVILVPPTENPREPAFHALSPIQAPPGAPPVAEPQLDIDDIQGNIVVGFNKDYQTYLFLKITDPAAAKLWICTIRPYIATSAEVLSFNRLFRAMRRRQGGNDPLGMIATWVHIAFSYNPLARLVSKEEADKFTDASFKIGLAKGSGVLGDPPDPNAEGSSASWLVGGSTNEADVLVVVQGDDPDILADQVKKIADSLQPSAGVKLIYRQDGRTREDLPGHEHFGFRDGISQPGVRGRVSPAPTDYLTPRFIDLADPAAALFAKPGTPLVWPGQFVLGYPRQSDQDPVTPLPPLQDTAPDWARNGSFMVVRRLRQDVIAFWKTLRSEALRLSKLKGFEHMTAERLGALLVGRWPSGAPVSRTPGADNPALAQDDLANNNFNFQADAAPPAILPSAGYKGDSYPRSAADTSGRICPFAAHVRKVNPRAQPTDLGVAADTLTRMILRRGVPFGPPLAAAQTKDNPTDTAKGQRGLIFVSYQSSIDEQFLKLSQRWVNRDNRPSPGGMDPVIGQNAARGMNRMRALQLTGTNGESATVSIPTDFVIPTGGGYFFSPSISALRNVIGTPPK